MFFSTYPAAFRFQSSTPPDNITLSSVNRKADQSLSDFQTGVGATAYTTLDTEQLISYLRVALVDTLFSLPDSEGGVFPVSEVCELLLKVHDNLDNAGSKQVGNSAHILAHVFDSLSRQHHEVWASQFTFLQSLKDVIPPSQAFLYGSINWSLVQAQQQFPWVCLSPFPIRRVAKPGHGLGSILQYRRGLCQGLVVHLWLRGSLGEWE